MDIQILKYGKEALLMSTHNLFYGELEKTVPILSANTP